MRRRPGTTRSRWFGFGLAFGGALIVAQLAVVAMTPRGETIDPLAVSASTYFSPAELDRARDFRRPQLAIVGGALVVEGAVLAWLTLRPPRRFPRRAVLAGAAVSATVAVAALPLSAVSRVRADHVGLVTQSWGAWAVDKLKSAAIGAVVAGVAAGVLMMLIRRLPRTWWMPGAALVVAVGAAFVYAGPVVLDPLFNRFGRLPAGQTRADVLALARTAGVEAKDVYVVDASRRTTAANAYVTGIGRTKRVVLYDTLLDSFDRDETRLVVAHELGHVAHHDVRNGLIYLAIVAPAGMFAVSRARPGTVPALMLAIFVVSTPIAWISNELSRAVEARADAYALRLTDSPEAFVSFERRIALQNVSDPDPPRAQAWLSTHPPALERIGMAEAYRDGAR